MDSDEEEMKSMRSSTRYGGSARKQVSAGGGDSDDDGDVAMGRTGAGGSSSSSARAFKPPPRKATEDEEEYATEAAMDEMMALGFMSFGKKKEVKTIGMEVHGATLRSKGTQLPGTGKPGEVQIGRRAADPVTAAGATSRAARAQEEAKAAAATAEKQAAQLAAAAASAARAVSRGGRGSRQDEDSDEAEPEEVPLPGREGDVLPMTHEVGIQAHEKAVSAMGLDPKAVRMVVGSIGGECKFYDFHGMSEEKSAFRVLEPVADHMVQAISFSPTGGALLIACSDSHARIYDRDGSSKPIQSTVKGDMYVRDMQHTKGHTQMLTGGQWHPFNNENWITSSLDGTIRIWDLNAVAVGMDQVLPSVHVLKTLDRRNVCVGGASGRTGGLHPCCCAYSPSDAKIIVGGCSDGSIQVFFEKARYMKPDRILRASAHSAAITDIAFIQKGTQSHLMASRSMDNTMKIWDTRMLSDAKGPVKTFEDLPCSHEKSGICASPCGRWIVAGTAHEKAAMGSATVKVWDCQDFHHVKTLDFGKKQPIKLAWPRELNQLIVGSSTGEVSMFYSPYSSKRGAMHFVGKRAKTKVDSDLGRAGPGPIFNMTDPEEIKKFYATGHGNMQKIRASEVRGSQKTLTPVRPTTKTNSQAATTDSMAFASMVLKNGAKLLHLQNTSGQEKDAQKALLKYAHVDKEGATGGGSLFGGAYKDSQPEKILDWSVEQSEGDNRMAAALKGDFCRKCGQKVCRCIDYSVWGKQKKPRTS